MISRSRQVKFLRVLTFDNSFNPCCKFLDIGVNTRFFCFSTTFAFAHDSWDKDSYRYGQSTPTLIFENLKPVEKSKNHFNILIILYSFYRCSNDFSISLLVSDFQRSVRECLDVNDSPTYLPPFFVKWCGSLTLF